MMKNFKNKRLVMMATALSVFAGVTGAYVYNKTMVGDAVRLSLKEFESGTTVAYKINSDGDVLGSGVAQVNSDGILDLAVPKSTGVGENIDYELTISDPKNEAEILDLFLGLNKENGDISLKGSGLSSFSSLAVKKGDVTNSLNTDWSGNISSDLEGILRSGTENKNEGMIEMAFRGAGIKSDITALGDKKIEIFLGEDLDYGLADIRERYGGALNSMTLQLSSAMVLQTRIIGGFIDSSIQLKTQRKLQELHAKAHKDYHPSEQMCRFGTFMRSVAHSEQKSEIDKYVLNRILMNKYLALDNSTTGGGTETDVPAMIRRYADLHCDPRDSGGSAAGICPDPQDTTLTRDELMEARDQLNKDVDYTRTLAGKLTLDINFVDGFVDDTDHTLTNDEQNVIAMARHLYFPNAFDALQEEEMEKTGLMPHFDSRSYAAKMNVAHSSFINIVGMKSSAPEGQETTTTQTSPTPAPLGTGVNTEPTNNGVPQQQTLPNTRSAPLTSTLPSETQNPLIDPTVLPPVVVPRQLPWGWRPLDEDAGWAYMKALMMEMGITGIDTNGDGDVLDAADITVGEQIDEMLGERPSYYAQMEVLTKKIYQTPDFYTNLYDKPANVERIGASIDAIALMNQRDRYETLLRQEMLTALLVEENLKTHVDDVNTQIYHVMERNQRRQN